MMEKFIEQATIKVREQKHVIGEQYKKRAVLIEALRTINLHCDNAVAVKEMLFKEFQKLPESSLEKNTAFNKYLEVTEENTALQKKYRKVLEDLKSLY